MSSHPGERWNQRTSSHRAFQIAKRALQLRAAEGVNRDPSDWDARRWLAAHRAELNALAAKWDRAGEDPLETLATAAAESKWNWTPPHVEEPPAPVVTAYVIGVGPIVATEHRLTAEEIARGKAHVAELRAQIEAQRARRANQARVEQLAAARGPE